MERDFPHFLPLVLFRVRIFSARFFEFGKLRTLRVLKEIRFPLAPRVGSL